MDILSAPGIGVLFLAVGALALLVELLHPGAVAAGALGAFALVLGALVLWAPPWASVGLATSAALACAGLVAVALLSVRRRWTRPAARLGPGSLVGREAVVVSALDPDGYVLIDGERWVAQTAGGPVLPGARVTVTRQEGLHLRVLPVVFTPPPTPPQLR